MPTVCAPGNWPMPKAQNFETSDLGVFQTTFLATVTGLRPADARLRIFHDTWFLGLLDVLRNRFEVTQTALGAEAFSAFARDYVRAHPLRHGHCNDYGADFPAFLAAHPAAANLPWLPDLAAFEGALNDAHHAADAEPADFEVLVRPETRCGLHPSVRRLTLSHDIAPLHAAIATGADTPVPSLRTHHLLIGRDRDDDVIWLELDPAASGFLDALAHRGSLTAAIDAVAPDDTTLPVLQTLLARLVPAGLITIL